MTRLPARKPAHEVVLRVRVVIPPVLAAKTDDGFPFENWQLCVLLKLFSIPFEYTQALVNNHRILTRVEKPE